MKSFMKNVKKWTRRIIEIRRRRWCIRMAHGSANQCMEAMAIYEFIYQKPSMQLPHHKSSQC